MGEKMNPYYQDDYVTIYHGDCLEIMPELPKVDLVLTDIPYCISQKGGGLRMLDYGDWDKQEGMEVVWGEYICSVAKGTVIVFCHKTQFSIFINLLNQHGFSTRTLIWIKPNPTVLNCDKLYIEGTELAVYGKRSGAFFLPKYKKNTWIESPPIDRVHPTQKPISLFGEFINDCTDKNHTILDPFLGSGTTAVAAKQLNRKCIGIEIEEKYCEIAAKRCSQEVLDLTQTRDG